IGSGTLRQVTPDSVPQNAGPLAAQNLIFDPNSLKGATDGTSARPFNADEIAYDVIYKATHGHDFDDITFRVNLARSRSSFIPYNVAVDITGEVAIGQVLGALGGLDIRGPDEGEVDLVNG